jgi:hypothetical protein
MAGVYCSFLATVVAAACSPRREPWEVIQYLTVSPDRGDSKCHWVSAKTANKIFNFFHSMTKRVTPTSKLTFIKSGNAGTPVRVSPDAKKTSFEFTPGCVAMNPLIDQLRARIRSVETGNRLDDGGVVKHDCESLDRLLPERGYPRGTLVQWLSGGGQGASYLSLRVARQACLDGGALVVIDPLNQFFAPAAAAMGISLDHLIVLRTGSSTSPAAENDLLWAIDQSLRCPAVAAVWGPIAEIDERWFRRFQLSAETSGCLGLFLQPLAAAKRPSWAEVQWLVSSSSTSDRRSPTPNLSSHSAWQKIRLQLTRCRGTHTGKSIQLTIDHVTGNVQPLRHENEHRLQAAHASHVMPVDSQLAHSTDDRRRA